MPGLVAILVAVISGDFREVSLKALTIALLLVLALYGLSDISSGPSEATVLSFLSFVSPLVGLFFILFFFPGFIRGLSWVILRSNFTLLLRGRATFWCRLFVLARIFHF